jgi:NTP pyrophosphatase (non-canonical NTP hydrolase)
MNIKMTDRAQEFMDAVWQRRNEGADTEEKLVAAILSLAAEAVKYYNAQNDMIVLDKIDLLQLAEELAQ